MKIRFVLEIRAARGRRFRQLNWIWPWGWDGAGVRGENHQELDGQELDGQELDGQELDGQ